MNEMYYVSLHYISIQLVVSMKLSRFTYFICFTIVLFPDSPAPKKKEKKCEKNPPNTFLVVEMPKVAKVVVLSFNLLVIYKTNKI